MCVLFFASCSSYNIQQKRPFSSNEINKIISLKILGDKFFIENFSNKSNFITVLCINKLNNNKVRGLPLKASWTHKNKRKRIFSDKNGIATFQLCSIRTNKKNQVLKIEIDTDFLLNGINENKMDSTTNYIEINVKTKRPKIFLVALIKNFGETLKSEKLINELKKYFTDEYFVDFTLNKLNSDFILDFNVDTFEKNTRNNLDFPYIVYSWSSLSLKGKNDTEEIFRISLPEVKAGDYDQKTNAGVKAIENLAKYIKNNHILN